jgi:tetratricopeptide (TPR) repeat protein
MNLVRWLAWVGLSAGLVACQTATPRSTHRLTGDPLIDGPQAIRAGPARDKVLWQYRMAQAHLRRGEYAQAREVLDEALARINAIYGPDKDARKARGYFEEESRKGFIGEPYERVMAFYYRGILYWRDGQPDNARACFRNGQIIDSDTESKTYAADYLLLDYLDGFVSDKLGDDGSDARKRADANAKMWRPPAFDQAANAIFFLEYGDGPTKYATGEYQQELRFRCGGSRVRSARVTVNGRELKAPPYDDLCFQATTRGGRVMDHILANKAVFKSATDTAGNVAIVGGGVMAATTSGDAQIAGLGLLAAGLISKAISASTKPQADTRAWDNLPMHLSFTFAQLPPGQHTATIEFLDSANQPLAGLTKTVTFTVAGGPDVPGSGHRRDTVIFVSDKSTTPQTL